MTWTSDDSDSDSDEIMEMGTGEIELPSGGEDDLEEEVDEAAIESASAADDAADQSDGIRDETGEVQLGTGEIELVALASRETRMRAADTLLAMPKRFCKW